RTARRSDAAARVRSRVRAAGTRQLARAPARRGRGGRPRRIVRCARAVDRRRARRRACRADRARLAPAAADRDGRVGAPAATLPRTRRRRSGRYARLRSRPARGARGTRRRAARGDAMTGPAPDDFAAALDADAVAGLAAIAFGSAPGTAQAGKHLAFLPPELLELELSDAEQRDFGDYELLERLGQGGMGVVYRARQKSLQRDVALKLLSAGPWASVEFIERFRREAQSAARLPHPNIVSIHENGQHAELDFVSMELVRGRNLARHIEEGGALPPVAAARLLRRLAEALDYAHRLGVLHLDLKPGNVLLGEDGEPRIADFGLARRLGEALAEDGAEISGTPGYMAPEQ